MENNVYKVAMIGCGHRANAHAPALKAEKRLKVVALVDIKPEAAEEMNTKYEFQANIYTDYHEMLEKEKPDLVVICLWTGLHLEALKACAKAGVKYIHSEKPIAPSWVEYLEAVNIASQYGLQLTYCHQRRFAKGNLLARKLIKDGVFGKILRMDLYSPRHLLDCGTHTFDQAFSFNGETPVKWVMGTGDLSKTFAYFDVPAESCFAGVMMYENGVQATVRVGIPDMDMGSGVRVIGEEGFIEVEWDGQIKKAVVYKQPDWKITEDIDTPHEEQMRGVIANIVDCMESGEMPELDYRRALKAGEVIFAFYESMRRKARVELPLTGAPGDNYIDTYLKKSN